MINSTLNVLTDVRIEKDVPFIIENNIDTFNLETLLSQNTALSKENSFCKLFSAYNIKNALSLDVSKTSTGIALLLNGNLYTFKISFTVTPKDSVFLEYALADSLKSVLELFSSIDFDLITIEENVLGSNNAVDFITLRKLIVMNYVVDDLINRGTLTTKNFDRIPVMSWKSDLNYISNDSGKYLNAKEQVKECLKYLKFPLVEIQDYMKKSELSKYGYQDRLDAVGILLSGAMRHNGITKEKKSVKKKTKKIKFLFDIYSEYSDVFEEYPNLNPSTTKIIKASTQHLINRIQKELEKRLSLTDDPNSISFLLQSKTLGDLGIEYNISDLEYDNYYIYIRWSPK